MSALFNGKNAGAWTQSRGLHYGDGVFRTVLIWQGQPLDWTLHVEKLSSDCAALNLQMPDISLLEAESHQLAHEQRRAVLKIIVTRQSEGRGYTPRTQNSDRLLLLQDAPSYPLSHWTEGIRAFQSPIALGHQPALAGIKHLNRLEQVLASQHWPDNMDEGILCDSAGQLVCGTRSNLFWVRSGELHTPILNKCGITGIMRNKIIKLNDILKVNINAVNASWKDLYDADEAFVCNALIGIWPLRSLGTHQWSAPGPITLSLQHLLNHPRLTG